MNTSFLAHTEGAFLLFAVLAYLGATLLLWAQTFFRADELTLEAERRHKQTGFFGYALLALGALLHGFSLVGQGGALFNSVAGVAGLFGFVVAVSCLAFQRLGRGAASAFIAPVALVGALYSLADAPLHHAIRPDEVRVLETQMLAVHVTIIIIGYAALSFAFAFSVIYLMQENLLKRKQLRGLWQRLPTLHDADETIFRATSFGLVMLSTGILTALLGMHQPPNYAPLADPKVLISLVTWLTFALYIGVRQILGWRGRRTNLVVVYGFVLLAISFFGVPHLVGGK